MTGYAAARQALLQVDDPATADVQRLVVITRAIYAKAGGDPADIKNWTVSQARAKIKKAFGKVTKETVQKMNALCPSRNDSSRPAPTAARITASDPTLADPLSCELAMDYIRKAKLFCKEVGGPDKAARLIAIIKEVQR